MRSNFSWSLDLILDVVALENMRHGIRLIPASLPSSPLLMPTSSSITRSKMLGGSRRA